ncbi:hypothetical protein SAMN05421805_12230 [Saccharopolyspora antimicrobica]|uniref:Uncharacterized protein n=2 Tax=Saccharopolyspora antimicrobica TaxID=455193 RepID=A0A1I5JBX3_9PSEU|nr:hypothetical protein ATL45_0705 [Saccharopolyspora antimicrobica]SFO70242.1 hypothetical protein SAMN05421805_12230 [Saccharopolyspora antimicrobica]
MAQWLWPIGLIADVAAVATLLSGSTKVLVVVLAAVALLLGTTLLATSFGKPVGWRVVVSVTGIVAGAVVIAVVATQALTVPVNVNADGQHHPVDTPSTEQPAPPSSAPVTASAPPTESPASDPAVKRQSGDKPIVLTSRYGLDLDSDAQYWITESSGDSSSSQDLTYDGYYLNAPWHLAAATPEATFEDCVRAGYRSYTDMNALEANSALCVKTSSGAYARVVITEKKSSQLTLDVVVWNKPS